MTTAPTVYNFRIAPNPTASRLTAQFSDNFREETTWKLFDLNGRLLQRHSLPEPSDQEIDMGMYPDGIYLLRFTTRQGELLQTFRIVKNH